MNPKLTNHLGRFVAPYAQDYAQDIPKTTFEAWRIGMGFSNSDAAHHLGLSERTVERYNSGDRIPPEPTLMLMDALVHYHDILAWPTDPVHIPEIEAMFAKKARPTIADQQSPTDGHRPTVAVQRSGILGKMLKLGCGTWEIFAKNF